MRRFWNLAVLTVMVWGASVGTASAVGLLACQGAGCNKTILVTPEPVSVYTMHVVHVNGTGQPVVHNLHFYTLQQCERAAARVEMQNRNTGGLKTFATCMAGTLKTEL